jgi:DNA-binding GntR family transcriptional regulator
MRLGTTRPQGHLHEVLEEHTVIVDALELRRPAAAARALADHLRHTDY